MPTETTPEILATVQQHETALRTNTGQYRPQEIAALALPVYWQQVLLLFEVQRQLAHCHADPVDAEVLSALDPGLRWLVAQRWPTRMPGPFLEEAQ